MFYMCLVQLSLRDVCFQPMRPDTVVVGCICLAPFVDETREYYRARVEKIEKDRNRTKVQVCHHILLEFMSCASGLGAASSVLWSRLDLFYLSMVRHECLPDCLGYETKHIHFTHELVGCSRTCQISHIGVLKFKRCMI